MTAKKSSLIWAKPIGKTVIYINQKNQRIQQKNCTRRMDPGHPVRIQKHIIRIAIVFFRAEIYLASVK